MHSLTIPELVRDNNKTYLQGYAAVWYDGTPATEATPPDLRGAKERIIRGAFSKPLKARQDTILRWDHNPHSILDRVSRSLQLEEDNYGLKYKAPYDSMDPEWEIVRSKINSKLCQGSSFWGRNAKYTMRDGVVEITEVNELIDVSPVINPAYRGTDPAIVRAYGGHYLDEVATEYRDWLETQSKIASIRLL